MTWGIASALAAVAGLVVGVVVKLFRIDRDQGERIARLEEWRSACRNERNRGWGGEA